jgi:hypothetical protein
VGDGADRDLVGIPLFLEIGVVLLIPIIFTMARRVTAHPLLAGAAVDVTTDAPAGGTRGDVSRGATNRDAGGLGDGGRRPDDRQAAARAGDRLGPAVLLNQHFGMSVVDTIRPGRSWRRSSP